MCALYAAQKDHKTKGTQCIIYSAYDITNIVAYPTTANSTTDTDLHSIKPAQLNFLWHRQQQNHYHFAKCISLHSPILQNIVFEPIMAFENH